MVPAALDTLTSAAKLRDRVVETPDGRISTDGLPSATPDLPGVGAPNDRMAKLPSTSRTARNVHKGLA